MGCARRSRASSAASSSPIRSTSGSPINCSASCSRPVAAELGGVTHLIFEPDGAMLRLPPNILVMDEASVAAYRARVAASRDNEFDFRGTAWLGRDRDVSTAVSAARLPRRAQRAAVAGQRAISRLRPERAAAARRDGRRRRAERRRRRLRLARGGLAQPDLRRRAGQRARPARRRQPRRGRDRHRRRLHRQRDPRAVGPATASGSSISPPTAWSPRRAPDCPTRPALLTSFGNERFGRAADLLRDFRPRARRRHHRPFGLRHRQPAGLTATEEAGVSGGGDFALDGLGSRLCWRRRPAHRRQPLAGAGQLQCDPAADHRPVHRRRPAPASPARCASPSAR